MSTKANPGEYDCYAKAEPNEPMFVVLGRDPTAAMLIELWTLLRDEPETDRKIIEARECARACEAWATKLGKEEALARVQQRWSEFLVWMGDAFDKADKASVSALRSATFKSEADDSSP